MSKEVNDRNYRELSEAISKGQISDVNNRMIFKNHTLCAQFLRDYIGLDILKDVKPEDIYDVTEKYQKYLGIAFETDTVKRVALRGMEHDMPMYLVSLIEHKSDVDYNVSMQLLQYMTCIWHDYELTMKQNKMGNARNRDFLYPPILPIVYYEGSKSWTAPMTLGERIFMNDVFSAYVPDFTYRLINLHQYTTDELLAHEDEMSFLMMLNRVQNVEDYNAFLNANRDRIRKIIDNASDGMMDIITKTFWNMLMKMNLSIEEAEECVKELGERDMGNWFENMEKMDIQAERRKTAEAEKKLEEAEKKVEESKKLLVEEQKKREETKRKLTEEQRKNEETERKLTEEHEETKRKLAETHITSIIKMCKKYTGDKEAAIKDIMSECKKDRAEAVELVEIYW